MPAYKNEKTGTWYCKFYYTDWKGVKQQKKKTGFNTKKEALAFEREFVQKQEASPDMSMKSLIELYLADCKQHLKPTTYQTKETIIEKKILPYFGDLKINEVSAQEVRMWQNELLSLEPRTRTQRKSLSDGSQSILSPNGRTTSPKGEKCVTGHCDSKEHYSQSKKYSPTYLRVINNQLSAIFNFAIKYYNLPKNPCHITGKIGKKKADEMEIWTVSEFNRFLDAVANKEKSYVMFQLLFWTGMRQGELLALNLNDFDFQEKTVRISKNYARIQKQNLIMSTKTNGSNRVIPIPEFLCNLVLQYSQSIYCSDPTERLFDATKYFLTHEMERGCKASGVKKIRVHDLRHSHASFLIEQGFSPVLIAKRLGHENIQTTLDTYSHLYPNKQAEVSELIEKIYLKKLNLE